MGRTEQAKRAYAEGAFRAFQAYGYEKNAAAQFAFKLAKDAEQQYLIDPIPDTPRRASGKKYLADAIPGSGVGKGMGLGALGGAHLGAGGAALASLLLKRNLMPKAIQKGLTHGAHDLVNPITSRGSSAGTAIKKFLAKNPEAASAIMGGGAGLGLGAIGGGLAGGLSD